MALFLPTAFYTPIAGAYAKVKNGSVIKIKKINSMFVQLQTVRYFSFAEFE